MNRFPQFITFFMLFFVLNSSFAQDKKSLVDSSYRYLYDKIEEFELTDTIQSMFYANKYLQKAVQEKDTLKLLESKALVRKYSMTGIAREVGYKNRNSFAEAFYRKTGIKPSYYIKQLEKQKV